MKGWVGLVGWYVADGLPTLVVNHQLQVERRRGKVRQSETDVLPLCHATNCVMCISVQIHSLLKLLENLSWCRWMLSKPRISWRCLLKWWTRQVHSLLKSLKTPLCSLSQMQRPFSFFGSFRSTCGCKGFRKVVSHDRFLAIWSLLHCRDVLSCCRWMLSKLRISWRCLLKWWTRQVHSLLLKSLQSRSLNRHVSQLLTYHHFHTLTLQLAASPNERHKEHIFTSGILIENNLKLFLLKRTWSWCERLLTSQQPKRSWT